VEAELAARRTGLAERHITAIDLRANLDEVFSMLPGKRVDELPDRVRSHARADLPLQVVDIVNAIRSVDADGRRSVFERQPRDQRQAHLAGDVEIRIVGAAEDFSFEEGMPAGSEFVDESRAESMDIGAGRILGCAQVVPLVVSPDRDLSFVSVVVDITARDHIAWRKRVIDARGIIALPGSRADGRSG